MGRSRWPERSTGPDRTVRDERVDVGRQTSGPTRAAAAEPAAIRRHRGRDAVGRLGEPEGLRPRQEPDGPPPDDPVASVGATTRTGRSGSCAASRRRVSHRPTDNRLGTADPSATAACPSSASSAVAFRSSNRGQVCENRRLRSRAPREAALESAPGTWVAGAGREPNRSAASRALTVRRARRPRRRRLPSPTTSTFPRCSSRSHLTDRSVRRWRDVRQRQHQPHRVRLPGDAPLREDPSDDTVVQVLQAHDAATRHGPPRRLMASRRRGGAFNLAPEQDSAPLPNGGQGAAWWKRTRGRRRSGYSALCDQWAAGPTPCKGTRNRWAYARDRQTESVWHSVMPPFRRRARTATHGDPDFRETGGLRRTERTPRAGCRRSAVQSTLDPGGGRLQGHDRTDCPPFGGGVARPGDGRMPGRRRGFAAGAAVSPRDRSFGSELAVAGPNTPSSLECSFAARTLTEAVWRCVAPSRERWPGFVRCDRPVAARSRTAPIGSPGTSEQSGAPWSRRAGFCGARVAQPGATVTVTAARRFSVNAVAGQRG